MKINPIEYFNPRSSQFPGINDQFKQLDTLQKIGVIVTSVFAVIGTFFIAGLGGLAFYRFAVKTLSSSNCSSETVRADNVGTDLLVEDNVNATFFQGTRNLYDPRYNRKGTDARTGVALEAAKFFLGLGSFGKFAPGFIDQILDRGIEKYQSLGISKEHASMENYRLSDYSLEREYFYEPVYTDAPITGKSYEFEVMLREATIEGFSIALIINIEGKTITLVCRSAEEFLLFDSLSGPEKNAYVEKFDSIETTSEAFKTKFPYDAELGDFFNTYHAYAVKLVNE